MLSGCDTTTPRARCRQHRCCVNYALLALGLVGCVRCGPRSTHPRAGEHLRPCRLALRSSPIARGVAGRYRAKRVRNNSAAAAALWMRWPGTTPEPSQLHSLWVCLLLHQLHCAASALLLLRCVLAQPARSPAVGRRCHAGGRLARTFFSHIGGIALPPVWWLGRCCALPALCRLRVFGTCVRLCGAPLPAGCARRRDASARARGQCGVEPFCSSAQTLCPSG